MAATLALEPSRLPSGVIVPLLKYPTLSSQQQHLVRTIL